MNAIASSRGWRGEGARARISRRIVQPRLFAGRKLQNVRDTREEFVTISGF
jgi:hypothetical protein